MGLNILRWQHLTVLALQLLLLAGLADMLAITLLFPLAALLTSLNRK
jgi:hypothetical protein